MLSVVTHSVVMLSVLGPLRDISQRLRTTSTDYKLQLQLKILHLVPQILKKINYIFFLYRLKQRFQS
jgi:hypothetical protein